MASLRSSPVRNGLAGLDRAGMERERLARLAARNPAAKRERSITPPSLAHDRPSKATRIGSAGISSLGKATIASASTTSRPTLLAYPKGKLLKTWAFGYGRSANDIKIEQVLERGTLNVALLSSYTWDYEWIFTKLDTVRTRLHLVGSEKNIVQAKERKAELESLGPTVKAYFPPLVGRAYCMHSKLMVLSHDHKLRVAIPSANLVDYDWGERGIMENTVWIIDLPRLPEDSVPASGTETDFKKELRHFLKEQCVHASVIEGLDKFDWSATSPYAFIHSIVGPQHGANLARTGLTGLSTAVQRLSLSTTAPQVRICASSIGVLNAPFLSRLAAAAAGKLSSTSPDLPVATTEALSSKMRLYYPTLEYVQASNGGTANGGTIWMARGTWEKRNFPRDLFREFRSTRKGLLSHSKLMFVLGSSALRAAGPGGEPVAYVYAGSANCSESAWGFMTVDGRGDARRLRIDPRNWEAGVLIPVRGPAVGDGDETDSDDGDETDSDDGAGPGQVSDWTALTELVDGPFDVHVAPIGEKTPWYCNEW